MPDILEEQIKKNKKAQINTWICGSCERHFITMVIMPTPKLCPFCSSLEIHLNDVEEITLEGHKK